MIRHGCVFAMISVVLVLAAASTGGAQPKPPDLSGRWRMNVRFDQGPVLATLELKQNGTGITGRLNAGFAGGEVPVEGDYTDGQLTFSGSTTSGPHPGMQLDFSAKVTADGTLAGVLSWQIGDFAWTAERVEE